MELLLLGVDQAAFTCFHMLYHCTLKFHTFECRSSFSPKKNFCRIFRLPSSSSDLSDAWVQLTFRATRKWAYSVFTVLCGQIVGKQVLLRFSEPVSSGSIKYEIQHLDVFPCFSFLATVECSLELEITGKCQDEWLIFLPNLVCL